MEKSLTLPIPDLDVLRRKIIPKLNKRFPKKAFLFQHDIALCRKSKIVTKYSRDYDVKMLDWLGNLPESNFIENLWAILNKRLAKIDCS